MEPFRMTILGFAVIFASSHYYSDASPRIINGITANVGDFPFYALISRKPQPYTRGAVTALPVHCGGTLIHPRFVVTAFHCFKMHNNESNTVVYFSVQNRCKPASYPPHEIRKLHYRYDSQVEFKIEHDIMVVELAQPRMVAFYAKLPQEPLNVGQIGTVIGFGLVKIIGSGSTNDLPCHLQQVNEFVLPLKRCGFVPNRVIGAFCSYNPLRNFATACRGDSGGPWLTRDANGNFILAGVSSFGDEKCNQEKFHDAFTNVYHYKNWITGIVNGFID